MGMGTLLIKTPLSFVRLDGQLYARDQVDSRAFRFPATIRTRPPPAPSKPLYRALSRARIIQNS